MTDFDADEMRDRIVAHLQRKFTMEATRQRDDLARSLRTVEEVMAPACKSTRYGPGCGHPTTAHTGTGDCCCCNWQHNDPIHGAACSRCRPIIRAYLKRQYGDRPIPAEFREPGDLGWPIKTHPLTGKARG